MDPAENKEIVANEAARRMFPDAVHRCVTKKSCN